MKPPVDIMPPPKLTVQEMSAYLASLVDKEQITPTTRPLRLVAATLAGFDLKLPNGQMFIIEVREI